MSTQFKVVVAGGRDFDDFELMCAKMDEFLANKKGIVIISGKAKGADALGEKYANWRGYGLEEYPADWDKYGKRAGLVRNADMANAADAAVCFWDGKSKGTLNMISQMRARNKPLRIVNYGTKANKQVK
jgi:hypothetical protein